MQLISPIVGSGSRVWRALALLHSLFRKQVILAALAEEPFSALASE